MSGLNGKKIIKHIREVWCGRTVRGVDCEVVEGV